MRSLLTLLIATTFVPAVFAQDVAPEAFNCFPSSRKTLFDWSQFGFAVPVDEDEGDEPERETLATDRPDFTEASSTVGRGVYQLETGYTFTYDNDGSVVRSHSWGEPLLRIGVYADWLEFRVAFFPLTESTTTGPTTVRNSGSEDLYLGFKIALTEQNGWLPESAILPQMTVPTGSATFANDSSLPGVNYLYSWELNDCWTLAGSTQFNRADDGGKEYTEWAQSISFARSLGENLGMYNEFFGLMPDNATTALPEYYFNGGFTYLLTDDIQWDIRAGVGLNDSADDFFAGTGFSFRFR